MGEITKTRRMEKDQQHQHQFLPNEIIIYILSRLPAGSIVRFKRVCKAWRSIVEEDPVFHDMHIRFATNTSLGFVKLEKVDNTTTTTHYVCFEEYKHDDDQKVMNFKRWRLPIKDDYYSREIHESLTIVGSCNGLICISGIPDHCRNQSQHTTTLLVCNPLTGEVVNLSQDSSINSSLDLVGIGFGYLPSINEYKIVRIYTSSHTRRLKHVQVYTLGSGNWRSIVSQIRSSSSWSDITFSYSFRIGEVSNLGVSVNGALYFNNRRNIVSFDLAKEEFRIIVLPPPTVPLITDIGIGGLGVLKGRLCATCSSRYLISSTMTTSGRIIINTDLWVLMERMDDKELEDFPNWIKIFSLPPQREDDRMYYFYGYRPLIIPPRILLQSNTRSPITIVSYNPETDHLRCRDIHGDERMAIPYVKSCVSLKALGETLQGKI